MVISFTVHLEVTAFEEESLSTNNDKESLSIFKHQQNSLSW